VLVLSFYILNFIKAGSYQEYKISDYIEVELRGEIAKEGIYKINRGSKLNDLLAIIEINENADLSGLSLNKTLLNNEIIIIPKLKEKELISINSASLSELITLPGIGETIAQRIIDYRREFGSFRSLEELKEVKGIGEKVFEKIRDYLCL